MVVAGVVPGRGGCRRGRAAFVRSQGSAGGERLGYCGVREDCGVSGPARESVRRWVRGLLGADRLRWSDPVGWGRAEPAGTGTCGGSPGGVT